MVKQTQAVSRLLPTNCLSVFDHFVGLALKGLRNSCFVLRLGCLLLLLQTFDISFSFYRK